MIKRLVNHSTIGQMRSKVSTICWGVAGELCPGHLSPGDDRNFFFPSNEGSNKIKKEKASKNENTLLTVTKMQIAVLLLRLYVNTPIAESKLLHAKRRVKYDSSAIHGTSSSFSFGLPKNARQYVAHNSLTNDVVPLNRKF